MLDDSLHVKLVLVCILFVLFGNLVLIIEENSMENFQEALHNVTSGITIRRPVIQGQYNFIDD